MRKILLPTLLPLFLIACGEPKLDGSSAEAMRKSIEKVTAALPEDQKKKFQSDFQAVAMSNVDFSKVMKGEQTSESAQADLIKKLDGKTAAQISSYADEMRIEREQREKAQALAEIKDLKDKQKSSEMALSELSKFVVLKSRFYVQQEEYSSIDQPVIEIHVKNETRSPVSRAYFEGTIASPGRSVPWLVEDFNYTISGGIEPGESKVWKLAPNKFSDWGSVKAPKDAIFTLKVTRLDGPDGEALYDAKKFSQSDRDRLERLLEKYKM